MKTLETRYGTLAGVQHRPLASNAKTDACTLSERNILPTPYGELVPLYAVEDMGRRNLKPVGFYKSGAMKSVPLQEQVSISTPVGDMPAELVTFYESGALKRVFPLDGKLSGFWSWQNEYALAKALTLDSPFGRVTAKVIALQFFESGALKSITLWPANTMKVQTPLGVFTARKGVAFYESGMIRSFEPLQKIRLETPIGSILAYDSEPNGIHGDVNSVQFAEEGTLEALKTVDHAVEVATPEGPVLFRPGIKSNVCGDEKKVSVPLSIRFAGGRAIFDEDPARSFALAGSRYRIMELKGAPGEPTWSCS